MLTIDKNNIHSVFPNSTINILGGGTIITEELVECCGGFRMIIKPMPMPIFDFYKYYLSIRQNIPFKRKYTLC